MYFTSIIKISLVLIIINLDFSHSAAQTKITSGDKVICTGDSIVLYSPSPRGDIQWQISTDGTVWNDIESANSDTLGIKPESSVYYRTKITEGTCEPFYTEHIIVEVDNSVSIPKNTFYY
jgi:hypothetical protein